MIKDSKTNKKTLINQSIINYKKRVIIVKYNLEVMIVIYEIHFEVGNQKKN
jgi:hypothetical protein